MLRRGKKRTASCLKKQEDLLSGSEAETRPEEAREEEGEGNVGGGSCTKGRRRERGRPKSQWRVEGASVGGRRRGRVRERDVSESL